MSTIGNNYLYPLSISEKSSLKIEGLSDNENAFKVNNEGLQASAEAYSSVNPPSLVSSVEPKILIDAQEYSYEKEESIEDKSNHAREDFLEYVEKTPIERIREQILEKLGITEEQLASLPPEERAKIEEDIAKEIEKRVKGEGATSQSSLDVLA